jgi:hypothetical protein
MKSIYFKNTPSVYYHSYDYIKESNEQSAWEFSSKNKNDLKIFDILFTLSTISLVSYFIYF